MLKPITSSIASRATYARLHSAPRSRLTPRLSVPQVRMRTQTVYRPHRAPASVDTSPELAASGKEAGGSAVAVQLPPLSHCRSAGSAGAGVRVRPSGVQRRAVRPRASTPGRTALPHRRGPIASADLSQAQPGTSVAERGLLGGAAAGP